MADWLITGGAGFIGQHLAASVLSSDPLARVSLLDIVAPQRVHWRLDLQGELQAGRLRLLQGDVRDYAGLRATSGPATVIANLAAVHREPGHRPEEYFETNLAGAENVCRLAQEIGCREIVFTSSISVYGRLQGRADESTPTRPSTPYGQSKIEAERIHREWAARGGGRLAILRPGVVFGPSEQGNVTRLLRESLRRDRAIRLAPDLLKAGIYIEEFLSLLHWLRARPVPEGGCLLVNAVSAETLTFNAFGRALQNLGRLGRPPLTLPARGLRLLTALMQPLAPFIAPGASYHPLRMAKLARANDICSAELVRMGYHWQWSLEKALGDWLDRGL